MIIIIIITKHPYIFYISRDCKHLGLKTIIIVIITIKLK